MTIFEQTLTVNNGNRIPQLGLGTWEIADDKVAEAVRQAIKLGYRHIDTAQDYFNEAGVGEGIRTSGVVREELFVTTKLSAAHKDYDSARAAIEGLLAKLNIDYIDLMIIHAPQPWANFRDGEHYFEGNLEAWRALEDFYQAGKIKAIGVSNFEVVDLENILNNGKVKPAVNQVLCHIGNTPFELIDFCQQHDIVVEAYSPIAHGAIIGHPAIQAMAEKYGVSLPQLCIKYDMQLNTVVLPKTANPDHMASNAELDFTITDADMETLKAIDSIDYGQASVFPVFSGK